MTDAQRSTELKQAVAAALDAHRPLRLDLLTAKLNATEQEICSALPDGMCVFTSGANFEKIWESLSTWESATFAVLHANHQIGVHGRIPPGKNKFGYYNLMSDDFGVGGHIKADAIAAIGFLSMPIMGLESHSVQFFGADGHVAFSVYVPRENHKHIPSILEAFLKMKEEYAQA